ncbi:MAG: TIGR04211 family SH3 domain-containing protein [Halioglobus sp.]
MQRALVLSLLLLIFSATTQAADTRYISDKQFIPVRSGPGNEYRIIHRGLPSGTRLEVSRTSDNGEFAEITTPKGTNGWIRTQYLMSDLPAQNKLGAALAKAQVLEKENSEMKAKTAELSSDRVNLLNQVSSSEGDLGTISQELAQLKQISGNAVQLDTDNRRLTLESEEMRSEVEILKAENQRLQDKLGSEAFMNGALAVLLGVIITLVVPRLWPKRRKSSSWA